MQEEVQQKLVTLTINSTKFTAKELREAIKKFLNYEKNKHNEKQNVIPRGKQSVKQLAAQNQGMTNIEITDKNIKDFDRVARKYGVDYAVKLDKSGDKPKYLVFFKARDTDALTAAFKDYTKLTITKQNHKQKQRTSIIEKLSNLKNTVKELPDKIKSKELSR